jgi:hypothetical protein
MLAAIEHLMRLHPAYCLGRCENRRLDLEALKELESGHLRLRHRHEYEADRRERNLTIREVTAVMAMLVVFCGVVAVIAFLADDTTDTKQQPVVAVSYAAE